MVLRSECGRRRGAAPDDAPFDLWLAAASGQDRDLRKALTNGIPDGSEGVKSQTLVGVEYWVRVGRPGMPYWCTCNGQSLADSSKPKTENRRLSELINHGHKPLPRWLRFPRTSRKSLFLCLATTPPRLACPAPTISRTLKCTRSQRRRRPPQSTRTNFSSPITDPDLKGWTQSSCPPTTSMIPKMTCHLQAHRRGLRARPSLLRVLRQRNTLALPRSPSSSPSSPMELNTDRNIELAPGPQQ
jgi:hypothetical protein